MSMQHPTSHERTKIIDYANVSLVNEQYTSMVYTRLSASYRTSDSLLSTRLASLAKEEAMHADFWMTFLLSRGIQQSVSINPYRISFLMQVYKILGIGLTLKILEIGERDAIEQYSFMLKSPDLTEGEKQGLLTLLADELKHEEDFKEYETKFKFFIGKVAIFNSQLSNGLVAIISVATGFAGIYATNIDIIIPSLIVGLTGALSTVTGFYFFGRTQYLVKKGILTRLKASTEAIPHLFTDRVRKYIQKKKLGEDTTQAIVTEATRNIDYLNQVIAEEEYGIKEEDLGNPLNNALYAGLFRVIGTIFPLIPYFLGLPTSVAIPISILITITLLAINGFLVALAAELNVKQKVMELTLSGAGLALLAFTIGRITSMLKSFI